MTLEMEQKALISQQQYEKIINDNTIESDIIQTNIYFETEDQYFKKLSSALRVRIIEDTYQLTLKVKVAQGNGHTEYNYDINEQEYEDMLATKKVPQQLKHIVNNDVTLSETYKIVTNRKSFEFMNHTVEVDSTNFGNITDYEVEIESEDLHTAKLVMKKFLDKYNISFISGCSKIKRYHEYNK